MESWPFFDNADVSLDLLIVDGGGGFEAAHSHAGRGSVGCRYMKTTGPVTQGQLNGWTEKQKQLKEKDQTQKQQKKNICYQATLSKEETSLPTVLLWSAPLKGECTTDQLTSSV